MSRIKYNDPWDDPTVDPEDVRYGDFEPDGIDALSIFQLDDPEDYLDDDE